MEHNEEPRREGGRGQVLSAAVLYILLSLAERDLHGYGIIQETRRISGGGYKLGPGTLYDNLRTLLSNGLVCEMAKDDDDRRHYGLTQAGKAALESELERMEAMVKAGRSRLEGPRPELAPGAVKEA